MANAGASPNTAGSMITTSGRRVAVTTTSSSRVFSFITSAVALTVRSGAAEAMAVSTSGASALGATGRPGVLLAVLLAGLRDVRALGVAALASAGINILMINTSETCISVVVQKNQGKLAEEKLKKVFDID